MSISQVCCVSWPGDSDITTLDLSLTFDTIVSRCLSQIQLKAYRSHPCPEQAWPWALSWDPSSLLFSSFSLHSHGNSIYKLNDVEYYCAEKLFVTFD